MLGTLKHVVNLARVRIKCALGIAPKDIIVTHGDADGICAAAVLIRVLKLTRFDLLFSGPRKIHEALRSLSLCRGRRIYILDIGINMNLLDNVLETLKTLRSRGCEVLWIDHHRWPQEAVDKVSKLAKLYVRHTPSATRAVAEYFNAFGDECVKKLVNIADDADTATYSTELAKIVSGAAARKTRKRAIVELATLCDLTPPVVEYARKVLEEREKRWQKALETLKVYTTRSGRKFLVIDVRGLNLYSVGPLTKDIAKKYGADFTIVIYSNKSMGFYAATDVEIDLLPLARLYGGGGHPKACGTELPLPFAEAIKAALYRIAGKKYITSAMRRVIEYAIENY